MNKLTPQQFEEDVINQMKTKSLMEVSMEFPLSDSYLADLQKFREDKLTIDLVTFTKDSIRKHITVNPEELQKFLAVEINKNRISSMYNERKASLDKPEEVTARHILVRTEGKVEADVKAQIEKIAKEVTPANFSKMAEKYSEDPSGKGKGGSLGAFSKGMMVPEFDQVAFTQKVGTISAPVKTNFGYHLILVEKKTPATVSKLTDYQDKFATELIQKDKVEEIKKLTVQLSNDLKKALEANNEKEVKSLVEKYGLSMKKADVNKVDGISTGANLSAQNMKEIFAGDLSQSKVILADDGNTINMIKTYPKTAPAIVADPAKNAENNASLKNVLNRKMMEGLLKNLEKETRIKLFSNLTE
jgi:parvulin-like peptidyl-prolyl isomerase